MRRLQDRKRCCQNCKWWSPPEYEDLMGECNLADSENGEPLHSSLAVAMDYEGYKAVLRTSAYFGCIQFWKKEVNPDA